MKRRIFQLFGFLFAVMMMLWAVPSQAMAAELQPRNVQQPSKVMVAQMAAPGMRSGVQPPKSQMQLQATEGVIPLSDSFDCLLCATCGGPAPHFSGISRSPGGSYEWGINCSGSGGWTSDEVPYLCCHD